MSAQNDCRPVAAATRLSLTGPGGVGQYIQPSPPPPGRRAARAVTLPGFTGASQSEIAIRLDKVRTVVIADCSNSMRVSLWSGDPDDVVGAAAESVFRLLRKFGGGRATVIHYGSDAPADRVFGPYDVKRELKPLVRAARDRPSLGGTNLHAGLSRALEVLSALTADETLIGWIFTDGIQDVSPQIHAAVNAFPTNSLHLCLIDRFNGCTPEIEAAWKTIPWNSFTRLDALDVRALGVQLAHVYATATGLSIATQSNSRKKV
jgi:hypothetical protein